MYKYISVLILCLFSYYTKAQVIEVKKFETMEKDLTAVMSPRKDINGADCALVFIKTYKQGLEFEGWVVGDVEYKDDAYWVFMANGAKNLKIKHSDYQTKTVLFSDYGIGNLKGGQMYYLSLVDETKDVISKIYSKGWNLDDMEVSNEARTFLRIAANRGDMKALIAMAQLSLEGEVRVVDGEVKHKGIHWIKKILATGDSTCLEQMPGELMYAYAYELIDEGYHSGDISIDRSLGRVDTIREKHVYTKACEFEIKACIKGFLQAGDDLFVHYLKSNGLPQYSKQIIKCCEDSANVGNIPAIKCLGWIYENGICEAADLKLASKWYLLLYQQNDNPSDLCRVYGNKNYPIRDEEMQFIREQADKGLDEALYQLGCMFEEGRNVQKDYEKAIELFSKCCLFNDSYHSSHEGAVIHMAKICYKRKEYDKAADLIVQGIRCPNMDATFLRGLIMYEGLCTHWGWRGSKEEAISLLSSIAKQGHKDAIDFLKMINN